MCICNVASKVHAPDHTKSLATQLLNLIRVPLVILLQKMQKMQKMQKKKMQNEAAKTSKPQSRRGLRTADAQHGNPAWNNCTEGCKELREPLGASTMQAS